MIARAVIAGGLCLSCVGMAACGGPPSTDIAPESDGLPMARSAMAGDIERGRALFSSRDGGHCVLCHAIDGLDTPFQGDVGPALTHVGDRLSANQIRLRIVDPARVWSDTIMPAYGRRGGLNQVGPAYEDQPILSAQDIEDLVSYLASETEGTP